jgi:hypothetical protein
MIRSSTLLLSFALLAAGCDDTGACAYGPSEIRDEALTAAAGEPIDAVIAFGDIDTSPFASGSAGVSSDDLPPGVTLSLTDEGVAVDGSVAEAGSYTFIAVVEADPGNACDAWARYDVTLTVE